MIKALYYTIRKNPIKFFLLKSAVLLIIIIILDFIAGNVLRYFYFKEDSGQQYLTTYSLERATEDLIIFGSSRADHHYQPLVFEDKLNISAYNAGRDNMFIVYHYAILKGMLERYTPKIIILDIIRGEFKYTENSYDKLSTLLPYYKSHPELRPVIELKSKTEKLKMLSSVYPYNSSIFTITIGNFDLNKKRWPDYKGYMPLNTTWGGPVRYDSLFNKYKTDSIKVRYYESFIRLCMNENIKLFIVCSPYLIQSRHKDISIELAKDIAGKNNIPFLDFSYDSHFTSEPELFADIEHLNDKGAKIFSYLVIDSISKSLALHSGNSGI